MASPLLVVLKNIVDEQKSLGMPNNIIRNLLKERLQYPVLNFIYSSNEYKNFIFIGGTCLRICFDGPRISEDLDFDLPDADYGKFDINKLASDLELYFKNEYLLPVECKVQGNYRIYLKFSILKQLGLAGEKAESDFLFLKLEPNKAGFPMEDAYELTAISKFGYNIVLKNYKISYMMTGKINALFQRIWFKGKDNEINIKGRDYFDFYWYLQKGVEPQWELLQRSVGISNREDLKNKFYDTVKKNVSAEKLSYDLKNFFPDQNFVTTFCANYEAMVRKYL